MNKQKQTKYLLSKGDSTAIANNLGCSYEQVKKLNIKGGKRNTELQKRVKRVLEFRTRQNENLVKFCKQIKVTKVLPK